MKSKSTVDEDSFISCKTPEAAYVLGFLWGDGYLTKGCEDYNFYKIATECSTCDLSTIEYLFNSTGRWSRKERSRAGRKPQLTLYCHNKNLFSFLEENNYVVKSGGNPIVLNLIPENLKHYWWRGYLDADGCIYFHEKNALRQLCFSSTYGQDWDFGESLFKSLGVDYSVKRTIQKNGNKSSMIRITGYDTVIKVCEYIYSGRQFGLKRKYDKFILIKNSRKRYSKQHGDLT